MNDSCVIVFARAPVPGATKTRLIPALGAEGAAELHRRLVVRMIIEAIAADIGPVELCCTPNTNHPFFADCAQRFGIVLRAQTGTDLGARMAAAFDQAFSSSSTVVLVGSDIPALNSQHLRLARTALRQAEAVFIPAEDGGYVLVGLAKRQPGLFEQVEWGGEQVMAQTRARARVLGVTVAELKPLWDLDRPADLARIEAELLAGLVPKFGFSS